jgi:hypothetical protein
VLSELFRFGKIDTGDDTGTHQKLTDLDRIVIAHFRFPEVSKPPTQQVPICRPKPALLTIYTAKVKNPTLMGLNSLRNQQN